MNQKETIKALLDSLPTIEIKKFFLIEWLEDINWHTECGLIRDSLTTRENDILETLQELDYLLNPAGYSQKWVEDFKKTADPLIQTQADGFADAHNIFTKEKNIVAKEKIFDFRRAKSFQQTVSYLYGWGICWKDWTSEGKGKAFVDELLELANQKSN